MPVRKVTLGREANGVDQILCVRGTAILCLDVPPMGLQIELSSDDSRFESGVFLDLKLLFDVREVAAQF